MSRWALTAACACGLAAAPERGAAETRPPYGGDLIGTLLGQPASLDPLVARTPAEVTAVGLVYDALYRIGPDGAVAPHLAAALPELDGGKARIALRPGVRFHDGTPVTAVDVVATLARVRASAAAGWLLAAVDDVAADGDTVVLTVPARKDLAALLAAPQLSITPRGQAPARMALPVGSGPFRVVGTRADRLELEAFDDHFAGRPYVDRVSLRWFSGDQDEVRLYERGGSHWSLRGATRFAGQTPRFATAEVESPATVLVYVGFGQARAEITDDRDFRAALDAALARGGLAVVGRGERAVPTVDVVPADLGGPPLPAEAKDSRLDVARADLARAAASVRALRGDRIGRLSLEVLVDRSRPDDAEVGDRVVRALDKLGVAATVKAVAADELARRVDAGTCDLYVGQLAPAVASPALILAQAYAVAGERDVAARLAAGAGVDLTRARTAFARRLPIVPLLHRAVRIHHRAEVRGMWFDSAARPGIADLFVWRR